MQGSFPAPATDIDVPTMFDYCLYNFTGGSLATQHATQFHGYHP
jgi:hypothetical protein